MWNDEIVQVGGTLAPLLPTPRIRINNGELEQWMEAKSETFGGNIAVRGEWRKVPKVNA